MKKKNRYWCYSLMMPLLISPAWAAGSFNFEALEDAYIKEDRPTRNYGRSRYLEVDKGIESLLKFKVETSDKIEEAKLRIFVTNGTKDGAAIYGVESDWSENSVNYSSKPKRLTGALDDKEKVSSDEYVEYDVSSFVKSSGVFSFNLAGESKDGMDFHSRFYTKPPKLIIKTSSQDSPLPDPSPTPSLPPDEEPPVINDPSPSEPSVELKFEPLEDSYVSYRNPDSNYGESNALEIDKGVESFVKFKVSGVKGAVKSAKIRFYVTNGSKDGPAIYSTSSDWSESNITFKTMPNRTSDILDDKDAVSSKSYIEYDVTSVVQADGIHSFNLASESKDGTDFHSRSGSNPPNLILSVDSDGSPAPTPAPAPAPQPVPEEPKEPAPAPAPVPAPEPTPEPTPEPEIPQQPSPEAPKDVKFSPIYDEVQFIDGQEYSVHSSFAEHTVTKSQNSKIYRFEVRPGDKRENDKDHRERSELKHRVDNPHDTEIWVSYSFMVEKGESISNMDAWQNMGQWHEDAGSPSLTFQMPQDDLLEIWTREGTAKDKDTITRYSKKDFKRGQWYNIVQHLKFNAKGKALCEIWIDGEKVVDLKDFNMGYTDSNRTYWKFGVYRRKLPITISAQYANMEFTNSGSLADRINNPKPIEP